MPVQQVFPEKTVTIYHRSGSDYDRTQTDKRVSRWTGPHLVSRVMEDQ